MKMVLSDVSIAISSAFSSDLVSTTAFRYVAAPRVEQSEADKERDAAQRRVLRRTAPSATTRAAAARRWSTARARRAPSAGPTAGRL